MYHESSTQRLTGRTICNEAFIKNVSALEFFPISSYSSAVKVMFVGESLEVPNPVHQQFGSSQKVEVDRGHDRDLEPLTDLQRLERVEDTVELVGVELQ